MPHPVAWSGRHARCEQGETFVNSRREDSLGNRVVVRKAKRLIRLVQMNAPPYLVCNEILGLYKSMPLLESGFKAIWEMEMKSKIGKAKNAVGLCCVENCDNGVCPNSADDPGEARCARCRQAQDQELDIEQYLAQSFESS